MDRRSAPLQSFYPNRVNLEDRQYVADPLLIGAVRPSEEDVAAEEEEEELPLDIDLRVVALEADRDPVPRLAEDVILVLILRVNSVLDRMDDKHNILINSFIK